MQVGALQSNIKVYHHAILDTVSPSDPILPRRGWWTVQRPRDTRTWFGPAKDNRAETRKPSTKPRHEFFASVLADVRRPPDRLPDGDKRRPRVSRELPIAPPVEPQRLPEQAMQEENDYAVEVAIETDPHGVGEGVEEIYQEGCCTFRSPPISDLGLS